MVPKILVFPVSRSYCISQSAKLPTPAYVDLYSLRSYAMKLRVYIEVYYSYRMLQGIECGANKFKTLRDEDILRVSIHILPPGFAVNS